MLMMAKADAYQVEASPPVAAAHILLMGWMPAPLPAAHDGDGIAGDGLDGAHAGHSAHNTGQRQRADDTGKDGGNITHKGFEKHFTVHR